MELLQKLLGILVILAMLILGVLFAIQNTQEVPLDLLIILLPERSIALWILLAFAAGAIVGMLASAGMLLRLRKELFISRGQIQRKNKEVEKLRIQDSKANS
jgi:putative membrane protein